MTVGHIFAAYIVTAVHIVTAQSVLVVAHIVAHIVIHIVAVHFHLSSFVGSSRSLMSYRFAL